MGTSGLYAQKKMFNKERVLLESTGVCEGTNPSFLQEIQDSILFTAKGSYTYEKGDFINYFEPNQAYKVEVLTDSYSRLNDRLVVFGLGAYSFHKGKNVKGSSFLYPYRTPFNFTEKEDNLKGDRRIENYHLVGGLSYMLTKKFSVGGKLDYQSINFAKLKDMRNINQILDLKASLGVSYRLSNTDVLGLSYKYKRYIESFSVMQEGKQGKDYYALVNKGSFMGLLHLYGENGVLGMDIKKPWVAIAHCLEIQNQHKFSSGIKVFTALNYEKEKGHFGNEGNISIMYFKHNRTQYGGLLKFVSKGNLFSSILSMEGHIEQLRNNERLYKMGTSEGGTTKVHYYGENETFRRNETAIALQYDCFVGDSYLKAPWHFDLSYHYVTKDRKTIYYPYFRKQNFSLHNATLGIERLFTVKKTDFSVHLISSFAFGNGGNPIDGLSVTVSGSTKKPDYLDALLFKEQEYLIAKRVVPEIRLRAERQYNEKARVFMELNTAYVKAFETKYLSDNYFSVNIAVGLTF